MLKKAGVSQGSARCAVDDPLCPSLYDGCGCLCDSDLDGTTLDQYRRRAVNAERMLLTLVRSVRSGQISDELLRSAARIAMEHEEK
ncbi:hypothetical protein [Burkholderia arboris]|uniref:hypothetical protein n=1 Tax=Burkholderia arboris TaxID=488730 RepID=UPI001CF1955B|nr:hypothetical protein [Burkholderia arboris]MCA8050766.1 hypothetical protein [Burkholderia arboris]